jgi:hypothetical protein
MVSTKIRADLHSQRAIIPNGGCFSFDVYVALLKEISTSVIVHQMLELDEIQRT